MTIRTAAGRSVRLRLAVFVSPHGFGHAARSAALLAALDERLRAAGRALEPTLLTTVPRWFFEESLAFPFAYRELACDVGLVQTSAVAEDLPATLDRLEGLWSESKGVRRRELQEELRTARLLVRSLKKSYSFILHWATRNEKKTIGVAVLLFVSTMALFPYLGTFVHP